MQKEKITALFDQHAATYDERFSKLSFVNHALYELTEAVFSELPATAHILCVGAGTGAEIMHLAEKFPEWRFTAVEPSVPMLDAFRCKAEERGILSRCTFHAGYLDSLPASDPFDAATSFMVSQFILDRELRVEFFQGIADRLRSGGLLVSADLACDFGTKDGQDLLKQWFKLMNAGGISDEGIEGMRKAYTDDVAVLPHRDVQEMIQRGGFESPALFYQAVMIHAWYAKRA